MSVKQFEAFANVKMARLEAEAVMMTQNRDASAAKAEPFLVEVQCVLRLVKEAKALCESESALETSMRLKVSKQSKKPTTR